MKLSEVVGINDLFPEPVVVDPFRLCADPNKEQRERALYEETMEYLDKRIEEEQARYDALQEQAAKQYAEVEKLQLQLKATCQHEETKKESKYFRGSYLDHASTDTRYVCCRCGTASDWKTETHSWYG